MVLMTLQLLSRVFNIFCMNNLELAGDKRRTVMRPPPPSSLRGAKKTGFFKFYDL